ncbi:hypothetical protein E2C01_022759 [Portunus trituberculatus]|uniref:Uncharacterized protein n=1 Tax=Portunus trituberculatus TaxID=210409 RepID=A0A5B7E677_PORTR|nr:hypothetical protein [Portunus trituberculatus]
MGRLLACPFTLLLQEVEVEEKSEGELEEEGRREGKGRERRRRVAGGRVNMVTAAGIPLHCPARHCTGGILIFQLPTPRWPRRRRAQARTPRRQARPKTQLTRP